MREGDRDWFDPLWTHERFEDATTDEVWDAYLKAEDSGHDAESFDALFARDTAFQAALMDALAPRFLRG